MNGKDDLLLVTLCKLPEVFLLFFFHFFAFLGCHFFQLSIKCQFRGGALFSGSFSPVFTQYTQTGLQIYRSFINVSVILKPFLPSVLISPDQVISIYIIDFFTDCI